MIGPGQIRYQLAKSIINSSVYEGEGLESYWQLIEDMNDAGFNMTNTSEADIKIWKKLVFNANLNTVSGITGLTCGEIIEDKSALRLMKNITREIVEVANSKGIALELEDSYQYAINLAAHNSGHYPSLAQDVAREVQTEIDALNGAVVTEAKKRGIKTPYNEAVTDIMKIIENHYDTGKKFIIS